MHHKEIEHLFQFYIREVGFKMKNSANTYLEPFDITPPQARIVGFINDKRKKGIPICQKDIESVMNIKGSSVTSLVQGLEKKGFITRNTNENDERVKNLSLTPKGQELVDVFDKVFEETEERIVRGMTKKQKEDFLQLLRMVSKNFEKR